ncbi:MLO-like protein 10 isoform X1 [Cucumis melo var. makuwa]|uniref:MLO-like protein n=1 Tax=Cucumis melo var. makuwa TaxID=1194695 RepID=A0A5D3CHT2_CUCMM|nr:MLO-like protein 10 isoform X1 [Cucumis melo var. makuwa]
MSVFCLCFCLLFTGVAASGGDGSPQSRDLDNTPTWAVAAVCFFFVLISIVLENVLHKLGTKKEKIERQRLTFHKICAELMILGFISLLLTFAQAYIVQICIPPSIANSMLPCPLKEKDASSSTTDEDEHHRRLQWLIRRSLAGGHNVVSCKDGKVSLISIDGLHQLHILIFFLAVFHVLFSVITMTLGRVKIRGWKEWEQETLTHNYEFFNDPARFRLTHETSFVKAHTSFWTRLPFFFYISCFFRQFYGSVSRADYLTLRNGFITVHLAPGSKFNFQRYIKRSLEDDFKVVVGVSPFLWSTFVIFLIFNRSGKITSFYLMTLTSRIILAVGSKLQAILTRMALEISEKHAVVQGIPLVQGSDKYFWFGRPQLILHLMHFALFQNAFQTTYILSTLYSFGLNSCFFGGRILTIIKVGLGVVALFLCSYVTLPIYALVNQMGSGMKRSIFDEQTSKALKKWHETAKKKRAKRASATKTLGGSSNASPLRSLRRFKTTGHSIRVPTYEDLESSDYEGDPSATPTQVSTSESINVDVEDGDEIQEIAETEQSHSTMQSKEGDEFSFIKPAPLG